MRKFIVGTFFLLAIAALIWGFVIEPNFILVTERVNLVSPKWNSKLNGLKILVAGDFHAGKEYFEKSRMRRVIDAIKAEKPDLVLYVGDYINHSTGTKLHQENIMNLDDLSDLFSEVKAPLGVYAIYGNHDVNFNNAVSVGQMLKKAGVVVLRNSTAVIDSSKGKFAIYGAIGTPLSSGASSRAMAKIGDEIPIIAMSHSPEGIIALTGRPVVVFAGHTHGGQVQIPFVGALSANCRLGSYFAEGLVDMGDSFLFTTRGVGTSRIPLRFCCPPTISVITMYSTDSNVEPSPAKPAGEI